MALLTESTFRRYLNRLLVVSPLEEKSVTGVGYDLTVGLCALVNPRSKQIESVEEWHRATSKRITLGKDRYAIVISREYVHLSSRVAATFHSKSGLAAQAVYLNSTTGDPNWSGRLIFSLYNASGVDVELDLDATFCTMVIHETTQPSRIRPKDSKAVIEKYLNGLSGDHKSVVGFVLRHDDSGDEFRKLADRVKSLDRFPRWLLQVAFSLADVLRYMRRHWLLSLIMVITLALAALWLLPSTPFFGLLSAGLERTSQVATIVGAFLSLLGLVLKK